MLENNVRQLLLIFIYGSIGFRVLMLWVCVLQIPIDISIDKPANKNGTGDAQPTAAEHRVDDEKFSTRKLLELTRAMGVNAVPSALEQLKKEEPVLKSPESSKRITIHSQTSSSSGFVKPDYSRPKQGVKDMYESLAHPSLKFSLTTPIGSSNSVVSIPSGIVEGNESAKGSTQHGQRARHIFPKPPKPSPGGGSDSIKGSSSQTRVPRPPAEGRGRNQLLPRYWPRITDQELQQLSGEYPSFTFCVCVYVCVLTSFLF